MQLEKAWKTVEERKECKNLVFFHEKMPFGACKIQRKDV